MPFRMRQTHFYGLCLIMHFYSWSKKACGIKIKLRNWTSKWSGNDLDLDSDQILKPIHSLGWIIWIAIFKRALSLSLSINALRACTHIYIQQLSSFRAPTLWFIDLTVATCHIQYTFLSLWKIIHEKTRQHKNTLRVQYKNGSQCLLGV